MNTDQHSFTTGAQLGVSIQETLTQEAGQTLSRPSVSNTKAKVQAPKTHAQKKRKLGLGCPDESVVSNLCCTDQTCVLR